MMARCIHNPAPLFKCPTTVALSVSYALSHFGDYAQCSDCGAIGAMSHGRSLGGSHRLKWLSLETVEIMRLPELAKEWNSRVDAEEKGSA